MIQFIRQSLRIQYQDHYSSLLLFIIGSYLINKQMTDINLLLIKFKQTMNKNRYYKAPKPVLKSEKQLKKQKPAWTTDFSDPDKYKLSEAQMIQRKAALQSKNRQSARRALQQRRKKLQMGIIDQETRKVYETALLSKKIDLNPVQRKNLSQMIQIQKQKRNSQMAKINKEHQDSEEEYQMENQEDIENQIQEAKKFIKKLEKAKKQGNIERAIDIMLDDKNTDDQSIKIKKEQRNHLILQKNIDEQNHEEKLSNIEETIKFMQERLFNPSKIRTQDSSSISKHAKINNFIENNTISLNEEDSLQIQQNSNNQFLQLHEKINSPCNKKRPRAPQRKYPSHQSMDQQLSQLRLEFEDKANIYEQQDEDCMSTIRRMREMIESKQHLYQPEILTKVDKENKMKFGNQKFMGDNQHKKLNEILDNQFGDEEVDFSLTMNEDKVEELQREIKSQKNSNFSKQNNNKYKEYETIKKTLFEEVDKLNSYCFNKKKQQHEAQNQDKIQISQVDGQFVKKNDNQRKKNKNKKKKVKQSDGLANQFKELRAMVEGNKSNVTKIQIEPIGVTNSSVMGFDYRGSINLKKNIAKMNQY